MRICKSFSEKFFKKEDYKHTIDFRMRDRLFSNNISIYFPELFTEFFIFVYNLA